MCFKQNSNKKWELTRFANINNKICIGTASKLFHFFIKHYNFNEIKSFADRRWSSALKENLYDKWIKYGIDFLETIDIQYIDLRECSNALIILIYNEKQLSNYIFRKL